jgi:3-deoxy-7-phosphoheptulonate synthase
MIIVLKPGTQESDIEDVCRRIEGLGLRAHVSRGEQRTVIGAIGDDRFKTRLQALEALDCVESLVPILQPFKLASREVHPTDTVIEVDGVRIGGPELTIMAGPCSVESEVQLRAVAEGVKAGGAHILRGGAFKPRTSPYAFQGLEEEGLKLLSEARKLTGLPIVTEVLEPDRVELVSEHADILQIGARNIQNFSLLKEVGQCRRPVLLKRGMATTIKEFLLSAEYVLAGGNRDVILCERGIRTFETSTRFTLDLNAVPVIKKLSHLPVVVDPSHGTGHWEYVAPMAKAGIACGADGVIIEVHNQPAEALSDGPQSLKPDKFARLVAELRMLAPAIGRTL